MEHVPNLNNKTAGDAISGCRQVPTNGALSNQLILISSNLHRLNQ